MSRKEVFKKNLKNRSRLIKNNHFDNLLVITLKNFEKANEIQGCLFLKKLLEKKEDQKLKISILIQ